jgi:hypothetical protein
MEYYISGELYCVRGVAIDGTEDMVFSHDGGKAVLSKIDLLPLGVQVTADVTDLHYADQAYSNTTPLAVTLQMVDGSELVVFSHEADAAGYISSGSDSFEQPDGKEFQTSQYEFKEMVEVGKVIGIYVEDLYVPVVK